MNRQQITEKLNFLFNLNNVIGLSMFIVLKVEGEFSVKRADITAGVRDALRNQFRTFLQNEIVNNDDLVFASILESDGKTKGVFTFDVEEKPDGVGSLSDLLEDEQVETFNFANESLEHLFGFIFLLGNAEEKIALYKKHYPINAIQRDRILMVKKSATRLEEVGEDIIKIDSSIQFVQIEDNLLILDTNTLERFFGFEQVIQARATANVNNLIAGTNFLVDQNGLLGRLTNVTFARKLMKLNENSPVLLVDFDKLKEFIKQHPKLSKSIKFNADESRIALQTNVSMELFIKLLDDDYLKSELTDFLYEADRKDVVTAEVEA